MGEEPERVMLKPLPSSATRESAERHPKSGRAELRAVQQGFTLIEVMMILVFLSLMIAPFTILLMQANKSARAVDVQGTRGMVLTSRIAEVNSPQIGNYTSTFNQSGGGGIATDVFMNIPSMIKTNLSTSVLGSSLDHYNTLYTFDLSGSYATANIIQKTLTFSNTNVYRFQGSNGNNNIDSVGNYWPRSNEYGYNASNDSSGLINTSSTSYDQTGTPVKNANAVDAVALYSRQLCSGGNGTPLNFAFDLPNGFYTLKIYFDEPNAITSQQRLTDITIGGTVSGTAIVGGTIINTAPYNIYDATNYAGTGGQNFANTLMYDVTVSNGTATTAGTLAISLNNPVRKTAGITTNGACISAIEIRKRTL